MARLSLYAQQRIVVLKSTGLGFSEIARCLQQEDIETSKQAVWRFWQSFLELGRIGRRPGSGRPSKVNGRVMALVEAYMQMNDETTATQLHQYLLRHGIDISLPTVVRSRRRLGWTFRGSAYCQLIREANKLKRLQWAQQYLHDDFVDVVWTDETTVQMESHKRQCWRKGGQRPKPKPRPKHPLKLHVWAGISWNGATEVVVFEGIMDASVYIEVLKRGLLPFLEQRYPSGHRFMQDNDPKHTSRATCQFMEENGINWWKTPPESPDSNPIENLWHELKVRA